MGDKSERKKKIVKLKRSELLTSFKFRKKIVRNRLEKVYRVEELHLKILKNFDNEKLHLEN